MKRFVEPKRTKHKNENNTKSEQSLYVSDGFLWYWTDLGLQHECMYVWYVVDKGRRREESVVATEAPTKEDMVVLNINIRSFQGSSSAFPRGVIQEEWRVGIFFGCCVVGSETMWPKEGTYSSKVHAIHLELQ